MDDLSSEAETQPASDPEWGQLHDVVSVSDGDTITVDVDGVRERVRVIGIDAPEMAGSGTAAECYAQPATSRMQSLLQGSRVHLLPDPTQADRDQYDRLLRHVVLDGGGHVGLILLEEGYAVERQYADPYQWQPERWPLRAGLRRQATLAGSCVRFCRDEDRRDIRRHGTRPACSRTSRASPQPSRRSARPYAWRWRCQATCHDPPVLFSALFSGFGFDVPLDHELYNVMDSTRGV